MIGKLKISRDEISEDGDGKECNKTYAKVRVEKVTDEDGSVTSVALTWVIDDARRGIVPMELKGKQAQTKLSFPPDTITPAESPVTVTVTVTATDDAGLTASRSGTFTLVDCD